MTVRAELLVEPWDVDSRLAELGLNREVLLRAVQAGFSAWAEGTANDPIPFPGYAMWAKASRTLRDLLAPSTFGWRRLNESNQCLVIDPTGSRVLIAATGDENTGNPDGIPKTKSKKGPRTIEAVERNRNRFLFDELEEDDANEVAASVDGRETWILLMFRDVNDQVVKSELSRPVLMDPERRIGGWSERIRLDNLPFGDVGQGSGSNSNGDVPKTPEIKVEIKRRA